MSLAMTAFAKGNEQMVRVLPGKTEFLLTCNEVILPVMYLKILVAAAMHTAVHIAGKYFLSLGLPIWVK